MFHALEWNHLSSRKRRTYHSVFQTYESNYVTRGHLIHLHTFLSLEYAHLLNSVLFIQAGYEHFRPFFHGPAEKSPGGNFTGMGVHRDAGYHKSDISCSITSCHALTYLALCIALPYHRNSILLRFHRIWQMLCDHIKNCFISRTLQR